MSNIVVHPPFDVDMWERPDAIPLLSDGLDYALDSWGSARQVLVVLLNAFNLSNKNKILVNIIIIFYHDDLTYLK